MKERELRDSLEKLQADIRGLESVDDASRTILGNLMSDIRRVLEPSEDSPSKCRRSLLERLRESTRHFEASHPDLTAAMERAIDTLTNMGI